MRSKYQYFYLSWNTSINLAFTYFTNGEVAVDLLVFFIVIFLANPKRARLFHDKSLSDEDTYEPFLRYVYLFLHFC